MFTVSLLSIKQIDAEVKRYQDTEMRRSGTGEQGTCARPTYRGPGDWDFLLIVLDCLLDNACLGKS